MPNPASTPSTPPGSGPAMPAAGPGSGPLRWGVTIYGKPVAQKRPRFARRGRFVQTYSEQETEAGMLYLAIKQAWGTRAPLTGPVSLGVEFGMPIPASVSDKKRRAMLANEIKHTKKPDLDNLIKFVKDVANGLLWVDDCQVWRMPTPVKVYAERPYTKIVLMED